MSEACKNCPCPDICLRREAFCAWAAKSPPVEVELRHICGRSAMGNAEYPSVAKMAGNLAGTIGRAATTVVSGKALLVSQDELERRLTICRSCDQYDAPKGRCKACGCAVNLKARLESETGKCPKTKW